MSTTPIRPPVDGLPETVPSRMVNEFVYCPRLFHLEWVQGRFATSDDVEEGRYVHRVVDEPGGELPDPDDDVERFAGRKSRSFWLTSTDLGVSAKIDIVEVTADGTVIPVDYKKGSPDKRGKAWPSDEIQSVLQALLLKEAGYQVTKAEIWYAETRRRIEIPIDDTRLDDTRRLLRRLWHTATQDQPPPPLDDSPKCPRCALVGLCLPDETNALRIRDRNVRRTRGIMAADPDARPVYVMEQGTVVGTRGNRLEIFKQSEKLVTYRLIDVLQLCVFGNVTITPQVMRELFAREIPVCWFSYGGWFSGMAEGLPSKHVELRRSQYTAAPETMLAAAGRMIEGKIKNSRTLLRRNHRTTPGEAVNQLAALANVAATPAGYPSLLGHEGTAARIYFSHFTGMLSGSTSLDTASFDLNGRARRPPPDPVNALLSFTYALLVKDLTTTLTTIGLDPYYGVFHRPRYGRPALALPLLGEVEGGLFPAAEAGLRCGVAAVALKVCWGLALPGRRGRAPLRPAQRHAGIDERPALFPAAEAGLRCGFSSIEQVPASYRSSSRPPSGSTRSPPGCASRRGRWPSSPAAIVTSPRRRSPRNCPG